MGQSLKQQLESSRGIVIVNFKTYLESTGDKALSLAQIMSAVSKETGVLFIASVQAVDMRMISSNVNIPIIAQHVDGVGPGSHTGSILPESIIEAGGVGTLLNHSERRLTFDELKLSVEASKKAGLVSFVCAESADEGARLFELGPDFIAVEPPELIGGDVSVTSANPNLISESVKLIGKNKVLVGAGVKSGEDVRVAKSLGAIGVLVASGVCKSEDPKSVLMDFAKNLV